MNEHVNCKPKSPPGTWASPLNTCPSWTGRPFGWALATTWLQSHQILHLQWETDQRAAPKTARTLLPTTCTSKRGSQLQCPGAWSGYMTKRLAPTPDLPGQRAAGAQPVSLELWLLWKECETCLLQTSQPGIAETNRHGDIFVSFFPGSSSLSLRAEPAPNQASSLLQAWEAIATLAWKGTTISPWRTRSNEAVTVSQTKGQKMIRCLRWAESQLCPRSISIRFDGLL